MRNLTALANQIRNVRDAEKRFMGLWRFEQLLIGTEVLDGLATDLAEMSAMMDELHSLEESSASENRRFGRLAEWSMHHPQRSDDLN